MAENSVSTLVAGSSPGGLQHLQRKSQIAPRAESAHSRMNLCEYSGMVQPLLETDGRNGRHASVIYCEGAEGRQGGSLQLTTDHQALKEFSHCGVVAASDHQAIEMSRAVRRVLGHAHS